MKQFIKAVISAVLEARLARQKSKLEIQYVIK
jgi:hypothetical protein